MIDYYLHKKCPLVSDKKQRENSRCKACIWLDKEIHKCVFGINYPKSITIDEFKQRMLIVNEEQQNKLSDPRRRFILNKEAKNDRTT